MEDADYAGLCTHMFRVCTKIKQSIFNAGKKEGQQNLLVSTYQRIKLMRHGEHHMIIRNSLYKLSVAFQLPFFRECSLTAGA